MFIDEVEIRVIAGRGGNGAIAWRREKYIPNGGPSGGNGGDGGDVYIQTTSNLNTLSDFRHKKVLVAGSGKNGGANLMQGARGEDLVLMVPIGTVVKDASSKEIIADLSQDNLKLLIAKGGRGGYGNAHFVSSTRQAPNFAEIGDVGEQKDIILELKLVADVGVIGMPNVGKSTLIGTITNVKPKIGNYPFTTLVPNLGVLEHKGKTLVLEDVPGLIPGASKGKGLGIEFLRHIERTKVLLHLLDLCRFDQVVKDYESIRYELKAFSPELDKKEEVIVFSKGDLLDKEMKDFIVSDFKKRFEKKRVFVISAVTGEGIEKLKDYLIDNLSTSISQSKEAKLVNESSLKVIDLKNKEDPRFVQLEHIGDFKFKVSGKRLEQIVRMTDFSNFEAVMRVYDVLEKLGVIKRVEKKLQNILKDKEIDNSFFFEGNDDSFSPKIVIAGKELPLDKLKYNL